MGSMGLGVGRAFGDFQFKLPECATGLWKDRSIVDDLVSVRPDTKSNKWHVGDAFLILGCDGIWDVMGNQDAVTHIHQNLDENKSLDDCAKSLVNFALER